MSKMETQTTITIQVRSNIWKRKQQSPFKLDLIYGNAICVIVLFHLLSSIYYVFAIDICSAVKLVCYRNRIYEYNDIIRKWVSL